MRGCFLQGAFLLKPWYEVIENQHSVSLATSHLQLASSRIVFIICLCKPFWRHSFSLFVTFSVSVNNMCVIYYFRREPDVEAVHNAYGAPPHPQTASLERVGERLGAIFISLKRMSLLERNTINTMLSNILSNRWLTLAELREKSQLGWTHNVYSVNSRVREGQP